MIEKLSKPLSRNTRRNLQRIKTLAIIILIVAVIAEYGYRKKAESLYENRITEYKEVMQDIKEELILVRNSVPIDIEKMGNITNTIVSIQTLVPDMELPAAEYYASIIVNEASKYDNINANMLVALIRQESNFMPDTTSWVGAIGLGQIMPTTGRWIVEDKWQLPYTDSVLFDPTLNIKITAWYLSYLMVTNNNKFKIALAYYNGGFWQAKRYKLLLRKNAGHKLTHEELAQIERMPKETQEYVPLVINNYKSIKDLRAKTIKAARH